MSDVKRLECGQYRCGLRKSKGDSASSECIELVESFHYDAALQRAEAAEAALAKAQSSLRIVQNAAMTLSQTSQVVSGMQLEKARKLHADTKPEMVESERAANALLTDEAERLSSALASRETELAQWDEKHAAVLTQLKAAEAALAALTAERSEAMKNLKANDEDDLLQSLALLQQNRDMLFAGVEDYFNQWKFDVGRLTKELLELRTAFASRDEALREATKLAALVAEIFKHEYGDGAEGDCASYAREWLSKHAPTAAPTGDAT